MWKTEFYLSEWWDEKVFIFLWDKKIEHSNNRITKPWGLNYKIYLISKEIKEMSLRLEIPYDTVLQAVINDENAGIINVRTII